MKKRNIIILCAIFCVIGLIIVFYNKDNKTYTEIGEIKYAILVDGVTESSFPTGNYKVNLSCTNADGYWDSMAQKIILNNISGDISCDISFNSITNSDYFNTYITSLIGQTQGEGEVINEISVIPNFNSISIVTSYGTTPVSFRNTFSTDNTQVEVDNFWNFNSTTGTFTSDPTKMTTTGSSAYYHVYAQIPSDGEYQICYTISQSVNNKNRLYIVKNNSSLTNISSSTSNQIGETCYDMGYLLTTDYINISELGFSGTDSPIITFRLEKDLNPSTYNTGYRYEGKNPNNFIMFNNELWRIIGVFSTEYDSNNDGTLDSNGNLVKLIRKDSIGGIAWDKNNTSDWPNSSLYHLLNEQYYDWETNKANVTTHCYGYSNTVPAKCNYTLIGIHDDYRDTIKNVKWYLGGPGKTGYTNNTPVYIYTYERDANAIYNGRSATTNGYIGLLYASDYLFAPLASSCSRTKAYSSYSGACVQRNWLYGVGNQWTITPRSNNANGVLDISSLGDINVNIINSRLGKGIRPTLYLSPDVYRVSGTGTITDPYIIGLAS